ncbi:MAG: hypothetical protein ACT4RN_22240, partial [Pseudonocardia sp.]
HAVLLARAPLPRGYVGDPEPRDVAGSPVPRIPVPEDAEVTVEAATVEHDRAGTPAVGYLVARVGDARFAARTPPGDEASARALSLWRTGDVAQEIVATKVRVTAHAANATVTPLT